MFIKLRQFLWVRPWFRCFLFALYLAYIQPYLILSFANQHALWWVFHHGKVVNCCCSCSLIFKSFKFCKYLIDFICWLLVHVCLVFLFKSLFLPNRFVARPFSRFPVTVLSLSCFKILFPFYHYQFFITGKTSLCHFFSFA